MSEQVYLRNKIRFLRSAQNITQTKLANQLGLSLRTYQRLENGQSPLDVQVLIHIAEFFNTTFYELTNPNISREELDSFEFFKNTEEMFSHAKLLSQDEKYVKDLYQMTLTGEISSSKMESFPLFRSCPIPFFFSDLKKTAHNAAFKRFCKMIKSPPLYNRFDHWKASEFCLKNLFIGFVKEKYYTFVLGSEDFPEAPRLLGFHIKTLKPNEGISLT